MSSARVSQKKTPAAAPAPRIRPPVHLPSRRHRSRFVPTNRGRAMAPLGCSSLLLRRRLRSGRPRPTSFLGIIALLSFARCLGPSFSQPSEGGGGSASSDDGEDDDAEVQPNGAERIHSNDIRDDQLMFALKAIQHSLASIDNSLKTIVTNQALLYNRHTTMMESLKAISQQLVVANKAVNMRKGLLGAMHSMADKLLTFVTSVLPWLLTNSSALNSPAQNSSALNSPAQNSSALNSPAQNSSAPKAIQNFEDPRIQVLMIGSLILYHFSFITMFLASKFKDSDSIDGVLFNFYIGLLLLVSLGFWSELCMIVHHFARISKYVIWPLGIFASILLVAFFLGIYVEKQKILKELKKGCVPANGVLPENPESEAASAQGPDPADSFALQISGPSSISDA